jgi:hypothetical protein
MQHLSSIEYISSVYKKIINNLECYLNHISTFLDLDNDKFINVYNISQIHGSTKFGITFKKPNNILELNRGYIGELTSENITVYFSHPTEHQCIPYIQHLELTCDINEKLLYAKNMPDLNNDIIPESVETVKLLYIQKIIQEYINFYKYILNKI